MNPHPFPFTHTIDVIFRDVDAMGHVNNAVFFTYMETARTRLMSRLFEIDRIDALPLILAETTCRYRAPLFFGETLTIGFGVSRFGTKSFTMLYRLDARPANDPAADPRHVADGRSVQVAYDYALGVTVAVPDAFRTAVNDAQQGWTPPEW